MKRTLVYPRLLLIFFLIGAISMLVMSAHYFQHRITGVMQGKAVAESLWYLVCLRGHIAFGLVAIFLGPFQLDNRLRAQKRMLHKRLGYIYTISVLISAVFGLIVAQYPMGGIITRVGFSLLAICWMYTLYRAVHSIRNGKIELHQKWMFINYGLTFAAITQRSLLLLPLFFGLDFMNIYRLSAWLPWMLNMVVAWVIYKQAAKKRTVSI
jgi:uncharacterized membrane protein